MSESVTREMLDRLDRMERQLRRWRRGTIAALGLAAVAVAGAMSAPPVQEMKVKTLRIVDDSGRDRIVLTADPSQTDMTFYDPSGKSRLTLDVAKDRRPVLVFADEAGKESSRLVMGLEEEGRPALMLYDGKGRKRLAMGLSNEGGPVIRILDENEKLKMRFP